MIWKCRLQRASHLVPLDLLARMPEWCIDQLVQEFRDRAPTAETTNNRVRAILQRDASDAVKEKAVSHFLDFFADRGDGPSGRHLEALQRGAIPRGWWPEYWRSIPSLRRACQQNQTKKNSLYRIYRTAIRKCLSRPGFLKSNQADEDPNDPSAVAVPHHNDRHIPKTNRVGQQYFDSRLRKKREWERKRDYGGGTHKRAVCLGGPNRSLG